MRQEIAGEGGPRRGGTAAGAPRHNGSMSDVLPQEILDAGLDDWRLLAQALHARYRTGSFTTGLAFVTAITQAAEEANHHPDLTLQGVHHD